MNSLRCCALSIAIAALLVTPRGATAASTNQSDVFRIRTNHVLFPLSSLPTDDSAHSITAIVTVFDRELFRETYQFGPGYRDRSLVLRLQGAGSRELLAAESRKPGAIKFKFTIEGVTSQTMTVPELVALQSSAVAAGALDVAPQVVLAPATTAGCTKAPKAMLPLIASTTKLAAAFSRPAKATNNVFVCPSASTTCQDNFYECVSHCDPGYNDSYCEQPCRDAYNECAYGTASQSTEEWYQPQYYLASDGGWDPWYAIWNITVWDEWNGVKHRRTYETYTCKYDGTFGPYLVSDDSWQLLCWTDTGYPTDSGAYHDCRF